MYSASHPSRLGRRFDSAQPHHPPPEWPLLTRITPRGTSIRTSAAVIVFGTVAMRSPICSIRLFAEGKNAELPQAPRRLHFAFPDHRGYSSRTIAKGA